MNSPVSHQVLREQRISEATFVILAQIWSKESLRQIIYTNIHIFLFCLLLFIKWIWIYLHQLDGIWLLLNLVFRKPIEYLYLQWHLWIIDKWFVFEFQCWKYLFERQKDNEINMPGSIFERINMNYWWERVLFVYEIVLNMFYIKSL